VYPQHGELRSPCSSRSKRYIAISFGTEVSSAGFGYCLQNLGLKFGRLGNGYPDDAAYLDSVAGISRIVRLWELLPLEYGGCCNCSDPLLGAQSGAAVRSGNLVNFRIGSRASFQISSECGGSYFHSWKLIEQSKNKAAIGLTACMVDGGISPSLSDENDVFRLPPRIRTKYPKSWSGMLWHGETVIAEMMSAVERIAGTSLMLGNWLREPRLSSAVLYEAQIRARTYTESKSISYSPSLKLVNKINASQCSALLIAR